MSKLLSAAAIAALTAIPAAAEDMCNGPVTIAEMNWASAGVAAWIDKIILEEGYGCAVELVSGDTVPTFTSMNEKGEPDVAPELWINAVRDLLEAALAEGRMVQAGDILSEGGVEGFWIPTDLAEKHGIKTIADALAHPELFPGAEDESKGAFFGCPSGWACQIITRNQFASLGGEEKGFELVDPGSAAGLDGSIARAFNRDEGWLGYYWAPTAILGKYKMTKLDLGVEHDADHWHKCTVDVDCLNPHLTEWPYSAVYTVATKEFAERAPAVMAYLDKRKWKNQTVNDLLAWMDEGQANSEDGAWHFLENNPDVWMQWVSPEIAAKLKSAL